MPRSCTICAHPNRDEIDQALVSGAAFPGLVAEYRVSKDALSRHRAGHIAPVLVKAQEAADAARGESLLDQLRELQRRTLGLLDQAEAAGKLTPAVLAVGQARGNLELMAKLLHELDERPIINLLIAPEWLTVRAALVEALRPYPDAAAAVASRLIALEAG
jgi:hypothetical protein